MHLLSATPKIRKGQQGFTIVELLIVIVVIAVIAAISIVAYSGVQNRAHTSALDADLRNASNQLEIEKAQEGTDVYATKSASGGDLKKSTGTAYQYSLTDGGQGYCLTATRANIAKHITNGGAPKDGVCAGHTAPVAGGGDSSQENGGVVTTFAGPGAYGYADAQREAARFNYPAGIAVDATGAIYVADAYNHRIRKVSHLATSQLWLALVLRATPTVKAKLHSLDFCGV